MGSEMCIRDRHTFEVDFLLCGNRSVVNRAVPNVFVKPTRIATAKKRLADEDVGVSGKEVLHLANTAGKGWFALELAEGISARTRIPTHILDAIAFATQDTISVQALRQMGLHRLSKTLRLKTALRKSGASLREMKELSTPSFLDTYKRQFPNDELSRILEMLKIGQQESE